MYVARTGQCRFLKGHNLPLGFREDEQYTQHTYAIDPGDVLLFYSDGITEAPDSRGEQFGTGRLAAFLRSHANLPAEQLNEQIRRVVTDFSGSETFQDDFTAVCIRVVPQAEVPAPEISRQTFDCDLKNLREIRRFLRQTCQAGLADDADSAWVHRLELAANEAASNIMIHAYQGRDDASFDVEIERLDGRVILTLTDTGIALDKRPESIPLPRFDGTQRHGFGLYLIRELVDDVYFHTYPDGRNIVQMACFHGPAGSFEAST
jgi:sigma-B regulation protein RsbU (phosphoserine phosphatase)